MGCILSFILVYNVRKLLECVFAVRFHACLWKLPYSVATQNVGAGERKVGEEETERMLEGRKPPLFGVPPASSSSLAFLSLALAS